MRLERDVLLNRTIGPEKKTVQPCKTHPRNQVLEEKGKKTQPQRTLVLDRKMLPTICLPWVGPPGSLPCVPLPALPFRR